MEAAGSCASGAASVTKLGGPARESRGDKAAYRKQQAASRACALRWGQGFGFRSSFPIEAPSIPRRRSENANP